MLRIRKNNKTDGGRFRKKKPTSFKVGPIVWIDFTDPRGIFTDNGVTQAGNGDTIYRVMNKAYDKRFAKQDPKAIGQYYDQPTAANRPALRLTAGGFMAQFDGTNDNLTATKSQGNVLTNILSQSVVNGRNLTAFMVQKRTNSSMVQGIGTWGIGANGDAGVSDDPFDFVTNQNDSDHMSMYAGDRSDKSGDTFTDSDISPTTNLELFTVKLGSSGSSHVYRNGNTADGTTTGASKDHDYDLTGNFTGNKFVVGARGLGGGMFEGYIAEIIIYNEQLPNNLIQSMERQLKQKYNL